MSPNNNNDASDPREYREFRNLLAEQLRQLENCHIQLEMFNTFLTEPSSKAKLPNFSDRIFKQNHEAPKDRLSALPAELKMHILSELNDIDKAMFALACKANAAFMDSLNLGHIGVTAKRRKAEKSKASLSRRASIGTRSLSRINKFKLLYRLRNEMPPKYRFCFNCIRFVSTRHRVENIGWSTQKRDYELQQKGGIARAMREGPRCPSCRAHESLEFDRASALRRELTRQVNAFKEVAGKLKVE